MKCLRKIVLCVAAVMATLSVVGCGGGGGALGAATAAVNVFAVDDMNTGFDHVWVTINKVELLNGTQSTTVFDETATGGRVVDLLTLHDGTGARFLLLGSSGAPAGTYTGAKVTLSKDLNVFTTGATTGTAATFAGATGSDFAMDLTFSPPQTVSAGHNLVVDFDLSTWTLTGNTVSSTGGLFVKKGSETGIEDETRHEHDAYRGEVSELAGSVPDQTFTLSHEHMSVKVRTSGSTTLVNDDGSVNPALSDAQHVEVRGVFNVTDKVLDATSIQIHKLSTNQDELGEVRGLVTANSSLGGTLTLTVAEAEHFVPSGTSITISTDSNTLYFSATGVAITPIEFFASLENNTSKLDAQGTVTSGNLLAKRIRLAEVEGGDHNLPRDVRLLGAASNIDTTAMTFDFTPSEHEGATIGSGTVVHVVTTSGTTYELRSGNSDATTFFTGLAATPNVRVRGSYDATTSTLTAMRITPAPTHG